MKRLKSLLAWTKNREKNHAEINLIFIFLFLNIWDFAVNRTFFNGMALGVLMFGPTIFLWVVGTVRAFALITLISILEFVVMAIFIAEGFELGGGSLTLKSLFWLPYLVMAGANSYWGLKIYSEYKEKQSK